ncbi:hypothetical protein GCM10010464_63140 [Pseudonocardia yunnanensis]|uniref:6-phosphogluconate dehydrogenase NADP-binding domain-containing protein n=1 Tax=Pseudonocardia yunnanensis TaxID=58107 RepID=A0ABW4ESZ5_9PSEU
MTQTVGIAGLGIMGGPMLAESPYVEEVVLGPGGVLENAEPGLLLIDGHRNGDSEG